MSEPTSYDVEANGVRLHVVEQGEGPVVLLCHGFPESWYSWRHQLPALAAAGYRAVALDQRGYGRSSAPEAVEAYTQLHLVGDLVGLLDALGEETAVVAGHDWGAPVAWNAALWRPDRFRAVIALSVPFTPRAPAPPTEILKARAGDTFHYMLYFQEPGVAEAELEADARATLRRFLYSASGDIPKEDVRWVGLPRTAAFLDGVVEPPALPGWLTEADLDFYTAEFARTGFRGGLNWYRNLDRTWELTAPWAGAQVAVPALFVGGTRDGVITANPKALDAMPRWVPNLADAVLLDGCGHWTQQERPEQVNAAVVGFLKGL